MNDSTYGGSLVGTWKDGHKSFILTAQTVWQKGAKMH